MGGKEMVVVEEMEGECKEEQEEEEELEEK